MNTRHQRRRRDLPRAVPRWDQPVYGGRRQAEHLRIPAGRPLHLPVQIPTFAEAGEADAGQPRRVVLGRNFRSRAAVLDACNYLFAAVMGETVGGFGVYRSGSVASGRADYYPDADDPRYRTEVLLVDAAGLGEDDDAPDKTALEARLAAQRIRALLDEGFPVWIRETGALRPVTPGYRDPAARHQNQGAHVHRRA